MCRSFALPISLRRLILACVVVGSGAGVGRADLWELDNGGVVRGERLNGDRRDAEVIVVRSRSGAELRFAADRVVRTVRERPIEREYEELAPTFADTVEGQWKLAEWCRRNKLAGPRETHLRRIVELDERFAPAWYGLGYVQLNGRWQKPADANRERGYEYHRGRWRLAQDIELSDERAKVRESQNDWKKRVSQLRSTLDSALRASGAADARRARWVTTELEEIRDPNAIPALSAFYLSEPRAPVRRQLLQTLGRIEGPAADSALFNAAMVDPDPDAFQQAVDLLEARRPPDLIETLVKALGSDRNSEVNRAAYLLGRSGDRTTIGPLIDALITRHWLPAPGSSGGGYSATFGRAEGSEAPTGAGLSKSEAQWIEVWTQNQDVLDALVKLSGGANFSFQTQAWRVWHAAERSRPAPAIDSRRQK